MDYLTIEKNGYTLEVYQVPVDMIENPRISNCIGHMYCWLNKYEIGDTNPFANFRDFLNWYRDNESKVDTLLPIYCYEHGGISISTSHGYPYNDKYDSGLAGVIYITKEEVENYSDKSKENIINLLEKSVDDYNNYLNSSYYSFSLKSADGTRYFGDNISSESLEKAIEHFKKENENDEILKMLFADIDEQNHYCL